VFGGGIHEQNFCLISTIKAVSVNCLLGNYQGGKIIKPHEESVVYCSVSQALVATSIETVEVRYGSTDSAQTPFSPLSRRNLL
jgi:outer membrane receptor for monomeric catechols